MRNFLMQYRTTPHCVTGEAPFERMFKRKMRTKFTLCLPELPKKSTNSNANKKAREFAVRERVLCRNYNSKIKWNFGTIIQRLGKLHYAIRLEDGRTWERHVDQTRRDKRGGEEDHHIESFTGVYEDEANVNGELTAHNDIAEPQGIQRNREKEQQQQEPEAMPSPQDEEERIPDPGPRRERPVRNKRPPQRYTDLKFGR